MMTRSPRGRTPYWKTVSYNFVNIPTKACLLGPYVLLLAVVLEQELNLYSEVQRLLNPATGRADAGLSVSSTLGLLL